MKNIIAYQLRYHAKFVGEPAPAWGDVLHPCAQEPRPEYIHNQWFADKESLPAIITSWCRNGWYYWLSPEDIEFNDKVPETEFMEPTEELPWDTYIHQFEDDLMKMRLVGTRIEDPTAFKSYCSELDRVVTQSCLDMSRRRVRSMEKALILIRDRDCSDVVDGTNEFQRLRDTAYNHIQAIKQQAGDALKN